MVDFWDRNFDVLVSTTIVSRAGHPEREHAAGGPGRRVRPVAAAPAARPGRPRPERGYTYFLYPPEKPLSETAHERLATVAQHTEMGAGMYVALKDLEIRGPGTCSAASSPGTSPGSASTCTCG